MNRLRILVVALVTGPAALLTAIAAPAAAANLCQGRPVTIVGTEADDILRGTAGADVIAALDGDDVVLAGAGDDVVCGGRGIDRLSGEDGDDALYGERNGLRPSEDQPDTNVGDTLAGGPGDDLLDPGWDVDTDVGGGFLPDTLTYAGAVAGVQVDLASGRATGEGADTLVLQGRVDLIGSEHADLLLGSAENDWIRSMGGDDTIDGRGGNDGLIDRLDQGPVDAPADNDLFIGGPGNDYLAPGRGDDFTRGGTGRDRIEDLWGVADLRGGPGDDELSAALVLGERDQSISGDGGTDQLLLAIDRDKVLVRRSRGRVDLGRGVAVARVAGLVARAEVRRFESLVVPEGVWRVRGTSRADTVFGPYLDRSRLVARMRGGADRVYGGPGDDLIVGGRGRDFARPSGGLDTCRSVETTPNEDLCETG